VNRVLRPSIAACFLSSLLSSNICAEPNSSGWSWPWNEKIQRHAQTLVHPDPQPVMRRDQGRAEELIRGDWMREKRQIERQHRHTLREYVETRLALAVEGARIEQMRARQIARQRHNTVYDSASDLNAPSSASEQSKKSASVLSAWWPPAGTNQSTTPRSRSSFADPIVDATKEIGRRTKNVLEGHDELVVANQAHGLPRGIAVFLGLLMLHTPPVALACGVIGFVLVRNHRSTLGTMFLGAAFLLAIVIFFVLPW